MIVAQNTAQENITVKHAGSRNRKRDLPLSKLETDASHLVEAGGVEPPSEKVLD